MDLVNVSVLTFQTLAHRNNLMNRGDPIQLQTCNKIKTIKMFEIIQHKPHHELSGGVQNKQNISHIARR